MSSTDDTAGETDEQGESGPSRFARVAHTIHHAGDYLVEIVALAALYGLATSGVSEALAQVLAGAIVTVSLGKRYAEQKLGNSH